MTAGIILSLLCFLNFSVERFQDSTGVRVQGSSITEDEFKRRRLLMVEQQLWARGISDKRVLKAMKKVPRHRFVPASQAHLAYSPRPLRIGYGQTISLPYIVAYMTEAAEVSSKDRVLEIGTGSGYQAAILSKLAKEVYTIEIIPELAERAHQTLGDLGYKNVHVMTGNGYEGWAEHAPYDAIVVTAAPDQIPQALIDQLALNGRMIVPVGTGYQQIVVIKKTRDGWIQRRTLPVYFVPMMKKPPQ